VIDGEVILKLWPIILAIIVLIVWAIRLESLTLYLEKDNKRLREEIVSKDKTIGDKFDALQAVLHRVLEAIGEIKGRINHN
jgi:hypothetical protein